jgi:hypothetical protein
MSYSVAAMVSSDVAATASNAHGAHQGHDNSWVSSGFATALQALPEPACSVE